MKITVTFNMFRDMMEDEYPNAFTYDALHLLFNWLEMLEDGGEEQEFDPGEIYGQYSETGLRQFAKDYGLTYSSYEEEFDDIEVVLDWKTMNDEQIKEVVNECLEKRTCILGFTDKDTVVFQDF